MEEVASSILASSTLRRELRISGAAARFLGGFVAGEGHFGVHRRPETFADGSPRLRFLFAVQVAAWDRPLLEQLRDGFGCGSIYEHRPGLPGHQPTASFEVRATRDHLAATVPFAEVFLLPGAKRDQFDRWRGALVAYLRDRPTQWGRGRSTCSEEGCDAPVRGRGLCRHHYHRATGH